MSAMFTLIVLLTHHVVQIFCEPQSPDDQYASVTTHCAFCDVDPFCETIGNCCQNKGGTLEPNFIEKYRVECVPTSLIPGIKDSKYALHEDRLFVKHVMMMTKCNQKSSNETLKELCENDNTRDTLESITPVSVSSTTYKNKFCAYCNNVGMDAYLQNWKLELYCDADLSRSTSSLVATVIRRKCNFFYIPPENAHIQKCLLKEKSQVCAVTVFGPLLDAATVESTCSAPYMAYQHPTNTTTICNSCYKNETVEYEISVCDLRSADPITEEISPPFSAILDLDALPKIPQVKRSDNCDPVTQFFDDKFIVCREILCHPYRYLRDGSCVHGRMSKISPTDYREKHTIFIKLTPRVLEGDEYVTENMLDLDCFVDNLQAMVASYIADSYTQDFRLYKKTSLKGKDTIIEFFAVRIMVHVLIFLDDRDVVHELFSNLHKNNFTLLPNIVFIVELVSYNFNFSDFEGNILVNTYARTPQTETDYNLIHVGVVNNKELHSIDFYTFRQFNKLYLCPFLELKVIELQVETDNGVFFFKNDLSNTSFEGWEFSQTEDTIQICVEEFKAYSKRNIIQTRIVSPKQLLAFFSVSLSIICLLITIITYLIFPDLHSQPGINNLILCISLLLAQTVYQFGASQRSMSVSACAVVGGICHFLWLSVMFAMNICSIEMFVVFKAVNKLPSKFSWNRTFRNILYVILCSSILVIVNIVVSFSISGGSHSGYGGSICYLSSHMMHLVTFFVPSVGTVTANILLFLYVVFKIGTTHFSSANLNQERSYLGIYARLSTLTGITWSFGFLQYFLHEDILEYIFIALNASQGVFIMVAFVLNKRICTLCRKMVGDENG